MKQNPSPNNVKFIMSIIQSKITRYTKKQEKISPITNKKINQMKDDEMTAMRDLIDKHLKIAIMYVPQMLKNINKTMNMMRGELGDSKKHQQEARRP